MAKNIDYRDLSNRNVYCKRLLRYVILGVFFVSVVFYFLYMNNIFVKIRMNQLVSAFMEKTDPVFSQNHMELLAKYQLNLNITQNKILSGKADNLMFNLYLNYYNDVDKDTKIEHVMENALNYPAQMLMNFHSMIMNKPLIESFVTANETYEDELALAYYYERNNLFHESILFYDKAIAERKKDDLRIPAIMLHQGFCCALVGDQDRARRLYTRIISEYNNENISIIALALLRYLDVFSRKQDEIMKDENVSLQKSIELYHFLAYEKALEMLNSKEVSSIESDQPLILYYKAKILNAMGKHEESLLFYMQLIRLYENNRYALSAVDRIYEMAVLTNNSFLKNISGKLDNIYGFEERNTKENDRLINYLSNNNTDSLIKIEINDEQLEWINRRLNSEKSVMMQYKEFLNKRIFVVTKNGSRYVGSAIKITDDSLTLDTVIGLVNIEKKNINKIDLDK